MKDIQDALVQLLKASIRQESVKLILEDSKWLELLKEAEAHGVQTLIMKQVKNNTKGIESVREQLREWEHAITLLNINYAVCLKNIPVLLARCEEEGIRLLGVKGVYIRYLYPSPDLRIMGDMDFLIHKEDRERLAEIIFGMGYHKSDESNEFVDVYDHDTAIRLEIHCKFFEPSENDWIETMEEKMWESARKIQIPEGTIFLPSDYLHGIFLLLHKAKHFMELGFGLRQLADFYLFLESSRLDIGELIKECERYDLDQFAISMLNICNRFYGLQVPEEFTYKNETDLMMQEVLIQEIFQGGVFGKKDGKGISKILSMIMFEKSDEDFTQNRLQRLLRLVFPLPTRLTNRYDYAKKFVFLLPIAWIHRGVSILFIRQIRLSEKIGVLTMNPDYEVRKTKLIKWMKLS